MYCNHNRKLLYTEIMIRHIKGKVDYISIDYVVVDVNGVGYQIYVSNPVAHSLDEEVKFFTHQAIRETASDLYGFKSLDELEVFELLLTLPGIGPKSAAQIMKQAEIELIKTSVTNEDPEHLSKMSGIGKKTAEKIVAGLKDKFEYLTAESYESTNSSSNSTTGFQSDAIDALISLGYPQSEARKIIQKLPPEINNANDAIKEALKQLGQG